MGIKVSKYIIGHSKCQLETIGKYIKDGGRVLVTVSSHDDRMPTSNINEITQAYGVTINTDCVIRTNKFRTNHPKEVLIKNGVTNRGILEEKAKEMEKSELVTDVSKDIFISSEKNESQSDDIQILYPYGATLTVERPSLVAMTSSKFAYPVNQAICSFFIGTNFASRLVVFGSTLFFHDNYISREENMLFAIVMLEFLVNDDFKLNIYDAKTAELDDYCRIPDLNYLSELPLSCFQDSEPVPENVQSLVEEKLFATDNANLPQILAAYEHLEMPHEKLTLIRPEFKNPMPKLKPATSGPLLRAPPGPRLEFYDLDSEFMPTRIKFMEAAATLVDGASLDEKSLEALISEFAAITKVPDNKIKSPREILDYVFRRIVTFKMVDAISM